MSERGWIVPIGGAEEKLRNPRILKRFAEVAGGPHARIAVVPTASRMPDTGPRYVKLFRKDLGVAEARTLDFQTRADCEAPELLDFLREATGVFFTGGNQLRLSTTLGGTPVTEIIRQRNREEGLDVAGTSAGASFLSEHMIAYGNEGPTPRADMVSLAPGMGLTEEIVVDQHFAQRDRLGRLLAALAYNPRPIGIGLDEDTAAFIDPEEGLEVVGSGAITIVDPSDMEFSSMDSARPHEPVTVIGVRLHVLAEGAGFDIPSRRARLPAAAG